MHVVRLKENFEKGPCIALILSTLSILAVLQANLQYAWA